MKIKAIAPGFSQEIDNGKLLMYSIVTFFDFDTTDVVEESKPIYVPIQKYASTDDLRLGLAEAVVAYADQQGHKMSLEDVIMV